jgi:hypothetical protein
VIAGVRDGLCDSRGVGGIGTGVRFGGLGVTGGSDRDSELLPPPLEPSPKACCESLAWYKIPSRHGQAQVRHLVVLERLVSNEIHHEKL